MLRNGIFVAPIYKPERGGMKLKNNPNGKNKTPAATSKYLSVRRTIVIRSVIKYGIASIICKPIFVILSAVSKKKFGSIEFIMPAVIEEDISRIIE